MDLLRQYHLALYFIKYKIYNDNSLQRLHEYNTRNKSNLRPPVYHTRLYRQSFLWKGIEIYNELIASPSIDLPNIFTLNTLKKTSQNLFSLKAIKANISTRCCIYVTIFRFILTGTEIQLILDATAL